MFGAHVSASGGIDTAIDRVEAIGGDCVQVFTQSPRMWRPTNHKPEAVARFRARRDEAGIERRRLPRALPRQPRGARRRDLPQVGRDARATRSTRPCAIGAEAVDLPRRLPPRRRVRGRASSARVDALEQILGRLRRRHVAAAWRTRRATGGTIGRSLGRAADARRAARRPSAARHLPRLVPPVRLGLRRHRPGRRGRARRGDRRSDRASTGCARCTSTTARRRSARTATATRTSSRERSARAWPLPRPPGVPAPRRLPRGARRGPERRDAPRSSRRRGQLARPRSLSRGLRPRRKCDDGRRGGVNVRTMTTSPRPPRRTSTTCTATSRGSRRPVRRRGSDGRDVRARAPALAPVRPAARLGADMALPGRADGRARPLPLRAAARRGASSSRRRPSGSKSGSSRGSRPSSRLRSPG